MALIQCKNLTLGYENKTVLENLSFKVDQGDYLCIVGENGSGKTTLMKALLGLIKPFSGKITFGDGLKNNEIGYLPQQTVVQKDFPAYVREIILTGCQCRMGLRPFYNKADKKLANDNMEKLGILHLANRCYRDLSGGQQQRVLLARALCATQKIILLDEPVSALDPNAVDEMYSLIKELNKKDNITIIMITHDIKSAVKYATNILHIGDTTFFVTNSEYQNTEYSRILFKQRRLSNDR